MRTNTRNLGARDALTHLGLEKTAGSAWRRWLSQGGVPANPKGGMAQLQALGPNAGSTPQGKQLVQGIRGFFNKAPMPTQSQVAMTAGLDRPKAREVGAFIESDPNFFRPGEGGRFTVQQEPVFSAGAARTPLQLRYLEASPGRTGTTYPWHGEGVKDIRATPEIQVPTGKPGKTVRGSNMTRAVWHEGAEEKALQSAMGVADARKSNPIPELAENGSNKGRIAALKAKLDAQQRRDGAVPYDTHFAPSVQVTEMASRPGRGLLLKPQPNAAQYVNLDEVATFNSNTPMEQLVRKSMRQVFPSPAGDFPVGGRHQRALNDVVTRAMVRDPTTYQQALDKSFAAGVQGLPLHPTLERHLMDHYDDYITRYTP